MKHTVDILHENCTVDKSYFIDIHGERFRARFKGYPNGNQYQPVFEITDPMGHVAILEEAPRN